MAQKVLLRCSSGLTVNIPKEIFKELGWKISEDVEIGIAEMHCDNGLILKEIYINRMVDIPLIDGYVEGNANA